METIDEEKLEPIYRRYAAGKSTTVSVLQEIQVRFGYVPEEAVYWFSRRSGIPVSKFYGIATFYAQFNLKPKGKNIVQNCCGTVCHVQGSKRILSRLKRELTFNEGENTTRDNLFTLEKVNCLGACSMAPVMVVNGRVYGGLTPGKAMRIINKYREEDRE